MLKHYITLIVLISILAYSYYKLIKKNKLSIVADDYVVVGRESGIATTASLAFIFICLCNLIINIMIITKELNWLADKEIYINLTDLLVQRKFTILLEAFSMDIRENIFEFHSLVTARKYLITSFYSIWFIFLGVYFYYKNSRFLYIVDDGVYKFGTLYRWDSDKLHQWDKIFGRLIINANIIDENGRQEIINLKIDKEDKKTLETLIGLDKFTDNNT